MQTRFPRGPLQHFPGLERPGLLRPGETARARQQPGSAAYSHLSVVIVNLTGVAHNDTSLIDSSSGGSHPPFVGAIRHFFATRGRGQRTAILDRARFGSLALVPAAQLLLAARVTSQPGADQKGGNRSIR